MKNKVTIVNTVLSSKKSKISKIDTKDRAILLTRGLVTSNTASKSLEKILKYNKMASKICLQNVFLNL